MNRPKFNLAQLLAAAVLGFTCHVRAQTSVTLIDFGASAPVPAANDVYQLTAPSAPNFPDGLNYYIDNSVPPGQTFTTGTNANGYALNSLFIRTAGDSGSLPSGGQSYTLRLYSVSGSTAALVATYVSQAGFTFTDLHWLELTNLSFGLQPNTQYAYTFVRNSAGYENLANVGGNLYAGGEVALIPAAGGTITYGTSHNYDASFDVGLSQAASLLINPLVISPSSSVGSGTTVTISTAPAVGPGPLGYQWQADGGSGTLTNIPGATSNSVSVDTTGFGAGTYRYALVVTNSSSLASAVATLSVTAMLADVGASAPTPGTDDVYQLTAPSAANSPDGLNYYIDNSVPPGQTFTAGTNATGYVLNSLFIRTAGDSGSLPSGGQSYTLRIYSVSGSTATLVATYVSQSGFTFTDLHWLRWTGLGLGLQPHAKYAYTFVRNSAGYENLANVAGNLYAGGEVALIPAAGGNMTYGSSHNYDASFDVGLSQAASLVVNLPVISPSNSVAAGTTATITTASAAGPGPLNYQWQTDGGSGGTLTNIPGANSTSFSVNTTGWPVGAYRYAVVVNNDSNSATSASATLTVTPRLSGNATLTDSGTTIATNANSISQLTGGGTGDGLIYYDDNNPPPGQTFTTGTNAFGYTLTSVSIRTGGGTSSGTGTAQGYSLYIYSVSGNQATLIGNFTNASFSFTYGDWLTWSGFSTLMLNPNSTYAYAFRRSTAGRAGMACSPASTDLYPGGQLCLIPAGGGTITFGNTGLADAVFSIELSPLGSKTFWDYDEFSDSFWKIINVNNGLPLISSAVGSSQTHSGTFGIEEEFQVLYNFEDDTYRLRSHDTWECIEAKNASSSVGTAVVEDPNYMDAAYQHWRLIDVGGGYYMIANSDSGLVLETDNGSPANVTLATPSPSSTRQQWRFDYYYHYPKKGIGQGNPDWNRFGISWFYDWMRNGYAPDPLPPHVAYEPMQWGLSNYGGAIALPTDCGPYRTNSKPVYIMAWNEPDRPDQANFSESLAMAEWPYFQGANLPIVAPTTSLGAEWGWVNPFYNDIWSRGYRVDYSAMHWYSSPSASAVINHANWIYSCWGNRVWITEFCNIAFGFTGTWSEEDAYDQLEEFLWRAEDDWNIARHAWFPQSRDPNTQTWDKWGVNAAMYMADWYTLTPLGEMWAAFDGDRTIHTQQPYYLHSRNQLQRVTARAGGNTVDHSTIRYGGAEQQISLVDAGSGKYYIQSALDGRRLSYDGTDTYTGLTWATVGMTGRNVEWTLADAGWGCYWINNPAHSVTLRGRCWRNSYGEPYSIYYDVDAMGNSSAGDETRFRLIKPYFSVNLNGELGRYGFEGNANDATPMANHGKVSPAGVSYVTGHGGGQAVQFDGASGCIQISSSVLQQKPHSENTSFTIAFWMKTSQTGGSGSQWTAGAGLVDGDVAGSASDFGISLLGGRVAFGCGRGVADTVADKTLLSTVSVNNGQWHHVAATRKSDGAMQLFVDGNLQASGSGPSQNRFAPQLLRFGGLLSGSNFYSGALDDARIFSYVLHSSQISALITNVPTPWIDADVGSPGFAGYANVKSGVWTIGGGGSGIANQWDQFHFVHQPVTGDRTLIARITALPTTWDGRTITNSKVGLMFRESTAGDAKFIGVTYSHSQGLQLLSRDATGASVTQAGGSAPISAAPFWLKLLRTGNAFTAYRAITPATPADGDWVLIGAHTNAMSTNLLTGIGVSSRDNNTIARAGLTSLQLVAPSPADAWRQLTFGFAANDGDAANGADPDSDGLINVWERAFGCNPKVADRNARPVAGLGTDVVTLTYHHNTAASDMSCQTEWSADLETWSTDDVTDVVLSSTNGVETHLASVPLNARDHLYLRLRLTLLP
jgi:hypothetical protein